MHMPSGRATRKAKKATCAWMRALLSRGERGVEVVVTLRTPPGTVQRFIESHRGWIEERGGPAIEALLPEQIEIVVPETGRPKYAPR